MTRIARLVRRRALALAALPVIAGCGILDIDEGGIIDFDDLEEAGPSGVAVLVNGVVGNYQEALDDIVRYTSLITDEMIMAGTFESRADVDRRRIQPNNQVLATGMYTRLHVARMQADTAVFLLQTYLTEPAFADVEDEIREGLARAKLYGGYSRIWLGELYCQSILTGMFPEPAPILPDARIQQARSFLLEAEARAGFAGLDDVRYAAVVGQARTHLWLGNYGQAAILAAAVPRDFAFWAEYSFNDEEQYNELYQFTWGDAQPIEWTVGDGTTTIRGNERFEFLDEFVALNLIDFEPDGYEAFNSTIPVMLQKIYRRPDSKILMASGVEAQLILAEIAVRIGDTQYAQDAINDLRSDYSFRATVNWGVEPPDSAGTLLPITLTDTLAVDLKTVADERARELWLTGDRHTTARRFRLYDGIDLFPPVKAGINGGDDIAFPIVDLELEANPNLTPANACPAGQTIGGWQ